MFGFGICVELIAGRAASEEMTEMKRMMKANGSKLVCCKRILRKYLDKILDGE